MRMLTVSEIGFVSGGDNSLLPPDIMHSDGSGTSYVFTTGGTGAPDGTSGSQHPTAPVAPGGVGGGIGAWVGKLGKLIDDLSKATQQSISVYFGPTKSETYACTDGHGNVVRDAAGNPLICTSNTSGGFSASYDGHILIE